MPEIKPAASQRHEHRVELARSGGAVPRPSVPWPPRTFGSLYGETRTAGCVPGHGGGRDASASTGIVAHHAHLRAQLLDGAGACRPGCWAARTPSPASAQLPQCVGHRGAMIAGGGGDHATDALVCSSSSDEDLVQRTAHLERSGVLQVLQLQRDLRVVVRPLEKRRSAPRRSRGCVGRMRSSASSTSCRNVHHVRLIERSAAPARGYDRAPAVR